MENNNYEHEAENYIEEIYQDLDLIEQLSLKLKDVNQSKKELIRLKRIVHSMKGVAGSYGFDLISTICHKLEDQLHHFDQSQIRCDELIDPILKFKDLLVRVTNAYKNKNDLDIQKIKNELGVFSHNHRAEVSANTVEHEQRKYLIIENSKTILNTIRKIISEDKNNDVSVAKDGYEALGRLFKEKYDVIISSLETPFIGATLLQQILHQTNNPNIYSKYIIISSSKDKIKNHSIDNLFYLEKTPTIKTDLQALIQTLFNQAELPVPKISERHQKLMLIDDTPDVFKLTQIAFKSHKNIELIYCQDSLQAESLILKSQPDVILLDLHMPELDGKQLLTKIKNNQSIKHIPVMFLTADDDKKEVFDLLNRGAEKVIRKPFNVKELPLQVFQKQSAAS